MKRTVWQFLIVVGLSGLHVAAEAEPSRTMLDRVEGGNWELRYRGESTARKQVCISGGSELVRLRHSHLKCGSVIVESTPAVVTVQYSCPGQGYGRTSIRRETDRLLQIDSQGIANGIPFAFSAEARRIGSCRK